MANQSSDFVETERTEDGSPIATTTNNVAIIDYTHGVIE